MRLFSNKRSRRNTAVAALLVWLFALSSALANACLLEDSSGHSHPHSHVTDAASAHAHVAPTGHSEGVANDEHESDVSKDACLKVCDDGAKAPVKLQASADLLDTGLPPLVAIAWDEATAVASAPCPKDDLRPPIVGPPFRVRYSRLAL